MKSSRQIEGNPRCTGLVILPVLVTLAVMLSSGCSSRKPAVDTTASPEETRLTESLDPAARQRIDRWCRLIETGQSYPERVKLEYVNQLINQAEFIFDAPQWGKADYWATPYELLVANMGDCEDFTIAKYFTLRELGVSDSRLRLTYVKAVDIRQAHMVLSYYSEPGAIPLVLDNLKPGIQPATSRPDLIPIFSFNGTGLWTAKARGDGKLVGSADRLSVWNELRNRMDDYTSQYLAAHAGQQQGSKVWFCR